MNHLMWLSAATLSLLAAASTSHAWHFECRFVERVGSQDIPLADNTIDASDGNRRNIRVQFGVFDDADGPAPIGGYTGWHLGWDSGLLIGSITISGPESNSDERRNNGRLQPFDFGGGPMANGNPPLPSGDPFTRLTEIDNSLGTQNPAWMCDAQGIAPPQPPPIVRGLNTFISTYAFSIDPRPGAISYDVTLDGFLRAATEWTIVGFATPPDCGNPNDPADDIPGAVTYAPHNAPARPFTRTLHVVVPAPASATISAVAGVVLTRRSRRLLVVRERVVVR